MVDPPLSNSYSLLCPWLTAAMFTAAKGCLESERTCWCMQHSSSGNYLIHTLFHNYKLRWPNAFLQRERECNYNSFPVYIKGYLMTKWYLFKAVWGLKLTICHTLFNLHIYIHETYSVFCMLQFTVLLQKIKSIEAHSYHEISHLHVKTTFNFCD